MAVLSNYRVWSVLITDGKYIEHFVLYGEEPPTPEQIFAAGIDFKPNPELVQFLKELVTKSNKKHNSFVSSNYVENDTSYIFQIVCSDPHEVGYFLAKR